MGIHKNVGRWGDWGDREMGRWGDGKDFNSVSHSYEVQEVQSSVLPRFPIPDSRFPILNSRIPVNRNP
ncbi:MAG: hypothetical protein F6K26_01705 [Moorea sp. SIO2I5]|nr:hypothetical protein [Moorena sp. SIO2I5]